MTSPGALAAMFAALTRAQRLEWMERYLAVRPEYPAESWVQAAGDNYSMHGQGLICNILTGVAPLVAASERERLAAVISPSSSAPWPTGSTRTTSSRRRCSGRPGWPAAVRSRTTCAGSRACSKGAPVPDRKADPRSGTGRPSSVIEMPTVQIPADCLCSWSVVRPGPGLDCVSRLAYVNAMCPCRHAADAAAREIGRIGG